MDWNLPHRITFQWHITEQCNFRCSHCYQDSFTDPGLSFDQEIIVLDKIRKFAASCREVHGFCKVHINFTGGEPFIRDDFLELISESKKEEGLTCGILTNGYLPQDLERLKELGPSFIQISLEGNEQTNDEIRGKGSFEKIVNSLKAYKRHKIPFIISFTANSQNYAQFPEVVKIGKKYGAARVWTDRYIPASADDKLTMNAAQASEFFHSIKKAQDKNRYSLFGNTDVSSGRALQFLACGGPPYSCSAGKHLLTILSNGDLLPCRRMPINIGNALSDDFVDVYLNNTTIREIHKPVQECEQCYYAKTCNGGLKCLSYALLEDFNRKDPNCLLPNSQVVY